MAFQIRDDFDGSAGANLVGRVPNISTTGEPWQEPSLGVNGDWWEFQLDGVGLAAAVEQPGADAGMAWATLNFPETDSIAMKLGVRSANGTSDLNGLSGSNYASLFGMYGATPIDIELFKTFVRFNSPIFLDVPHDIVGEGGAVAEIEIRWGGGLLTVIVNDVTVHADGLADGEGSGYVQFNVVGNNALSYAEVSSLETPEASAFWTDFVAAREVL
ncbi:hypothetical protein GmRootV59_13190 [Variovorax sp. V59]|uniref:hypothetical protein n=1 Tax=unclassified Variovorax TaxID=663243 RepID=UPI0034E89E04